MAWAKIPRRLVEQCEACWTTVVFYCYYIKGVFSFSEELLSRHKEKNVRKFFIILIVMNMQNSWKMIYFYFYFKKNVSNDLQSWFIIFIIKTREEKKKVLDRVDKLIRWCANTYTWPKDSSWLNLRPNCTQTMDFSSVCLSLGAKYVMYMQYVIPYVILQFIRKSPSHIQTSRNWWSCRKYPRPAARRSGCLFQLCPLELCQVSDISGPQVPHL